MCKVCFASDYPIYILADMLMSEKLVSHAHMKTFPGGVGYTMSEVRGLQPINSSIHQLTKHLIYNCYGCKMFKAVACPTPVVGDLPLNATSGSRQLQLTGIALSRPLIYIKRRK